MFEHFTKADLSMLAKIGAGFLIGMFGLIGLFGINGLETGSQNPPPPRESAARTEIQIRGNKRSKIYHLPGCPNYDDIALKNRVYFSSHEEARAAGYRAARNC